jgi:5-(carboxyamino)imidazole ribonucleotide mutase
MISIVMGSDSDYKIMEEAENILKEFGVEYEIKIVSAHRTPDRLVEYAKNAKSNGIKVIIAGAGGSAHLPGMIASMTTLPVIGVPVITKTMSGMDSLYSIVQMPPGIPVATMAINGSKNAGLFAIQILALQIPNLSQKLDEYRENMKNKVLSKSQELFSK